jgi:predicted N-acetyltransferase YhbS
VVPRAVTITHADREWHEAFLRFVPRVFPSIGFRGWYEHGGWDERYVVHACVEGDELVASASVQRMELVLHGQRVRGHQLGAVGTLPTHRQRGLQRGVMERALQGVAPDDLAFLFANERVLEFYPRFGFSRMRESVSAAERRVVPGGAPLRALDLASADDRATLRRVAQRATPVTSRFGARDYGGVVLWYWSNFFPRALRYTEEHDAIVIADQHGERLHVYDVLAAGELDVEAMLGRVVTAPVSSVVLGFTPDRYFTDARPIAEYSESPLFVRGAQRMPEGPFKYPMLAQT